MAYFASCDPLYYNKVSEIDQFDEILVRIESSRWLTNSKYNNTVHAKNLTATDHGLAMRILLPSLQCALETRK